jgi:hypothetical protein
MGVDSNLMHKISVTFGEMPEGKYMGFVMPNVTFWFYLIIRQTSAKATLWVR